MHGVSCRALPRLRQIRDNKRRAILPHELCRGFFVAFAGPRVGVEMERSSQPIREIRQVNEHGGSRTLFDLCRQIRALAAAHRGVKIGMMIAVAVADGPSSCSFPSQVL